MKFKFTLAVICLLLTGLNLFFLQANQASSAQVNATRQQLTWLTQTLSTHPDTEVIPNKRNPGGALAVMKRLELEARRADLDELLTRMEQQAAGEVELVFESIAFNQLLIWLEQVYQSTDLQPLRVLIQRLPAKASVRAEIVFF